MQNYQVGHSSESETVIMATMEEWARIRALKDFIPRTEYEELMAAIGDKTSHIVNSIQ